MVRGREADAAWTGAEDSCAHNGHVEHFQPQVGYTRGTGGTARVRFVAKAGAPHNRRPCQHDIAVFSTPPLQFKLAPCLQAVLVSMCPPPLRRPMPPLSITPGTLLKSLIIVEQNTTLGTKCLNSKKDMNGTAQHKHAKNDS